MSKRGTIGDALAWLGKSKSLNADAMTPSAWAYEANRMWHAAEPIIKAYVNQLPAEDADEIARLTRERDLARAECRAQRAIDALCDKPLGDPALEREEFWPMFVAANKALDAARAANPMEDQ